MFRAPFQVLLPMTYYILSRRRANVEYLRVFGSLTKITIPWAKRDRDHHFADRGYLGIYLGPSERSPGCIVYVPANCKLYVTRNLICYEDVQPGIQHVESRWREFTERRTPQLIPLNNPDSLSLDSTDRGEVSVPTASNDAMRSTEGPVLESSEQEPPSIRDADGRDEYLEFDQPEMRENTDELNVVVRKTISHLHGSLSGYWQSLSGQPHTHWSAAHLCVRLDFPIQRICHQSTETTESTNLQ